jgi:hypothetical protein
MLLQQLAQLKQSTSFQTSASMAGAFLSKSLGGLRPIFDKKLLKDFSCFFAFCLNDLRFTCIS